MNSFIDTSTVLNVSPCKVKLPYNCEFAHPGALVWSTARLLPLVTNSDRQTLYKGSLGLNNSGRSELVKTLSLPVECFKWHTIEIDERWSSMAFSALAWLRAQWFPLPAVSPAVPAVPLSPFRTFPQLRADQLPPSRGGVAAARWAGPVSRGARARPPACPPCSILPQRPPVVAQPGTGTGGSSGHRPFPRAGIGLPSAPGSGGTSLPAVWSRVRLRCFPFPCCRGPRSLPRRCPRSRARSPVFPGAARREWEGSPGRARRGRRPRALPGAGAGGGECGVTGIP